MTDATIPSWPFAISARLSLADLIGAINAPLPLTTPPPAKPPLRISSADARTQDLFRALVRQGGCSRGAIDRIVPARFNIGRRIAPYGYSVWACVSLLDGPRYWAVPIGEPNPFSRPAWVI